MPSPPTMTTCCCRRRPRTTRWAMDGSCGSGQTTYQGLTDVPFAVPGRHIAQINNSSTSYVQLGFDDTTEACIRAVEGWVAWDPQNTKYDNNGTTKVADGSTETTVFSGKMSYT